MGDPERIPEITEKLLKLWQLHPDLRFIQLIDYIKSFASYYDKCDTDPYYWEDDFLCKLLDLAIKTA